MSLLHLEPLPARVTKGDLLRFVCEQGKLDGKRVGRIDIAGRLATIEVPDSCEARLLRALDGATLRDRRLRVWSIGEQRAIPAADHFQRLASLLELESDAEAQQILEQRQRLSADEAEQSGNCLVHLIVYEEFGGLGGRFLLTLGKRDRSKKLPWTRLQSGTPVLLSAQSSRGEVSWRGVVCERAESAITVAFNDPIEDDHEQPLYRLDLSSDEASRLRQRAALQQAGQAGQDRLAELRAILLGEAEPSFSEATSDPVLDAALNDSQREAVRLALSAHDLAIIHGPPGTGKTTTVVEVIRQAVRRGDKVLVCAPSNLAVDNLLERLLGHGERAVRLGHPARVLPQLRAHTLDLMVDHHADMRQARKLAKEAYGLFRQASKFTRARPEPGARRDMRQEGRALLADARRLEALAVERILDVAPILCSTTTGLDSEIIGQRRFNLLVIDEACQSTEPGCWIPLLRCDRVVLAGDHCQLPPTVLSKEAMRQGFGISLLERLIAEHGDAVTRLLTVQYRMHEQIMHFSSREFYEEQLQADSSVRNHRLCDLPGVRAEPLTETPVEFIDTAGASYEEEREPDGESRLNPQESAVVSRKVRGLVDAGVRPVDIAVIAPYAAQVRRLRQDLAGMEGLEIDSVDGFQGREKEAVVLSLVRSNTEGEIGFLGDVRRMNVALTRGRRKLLVVGDSATLSILPFYQRLFEYFEAIGSYHTVWEEPDS
jgi:ATP-dependent RNA/DNA helicase IGHMBP2